MLDNDDKCDMGSHDAILTYTQWVAIWQMLC